MNAGGNLSFRVYRLPRELPEDYIERLQAKALPPVETLSATPISGWVTGRHALDRNITAESAVHAGFLRIALVQVEKKVPTPLLKAECRMEEDAHCKALGVTRLSRDQRAEIRKGIEERLRPQALPTISAIPVVHDAQANLLYVGALSLSQADVFVIQFHQTFGVMPIPLFHVAGGLPKFAFTVAVDVEECVHEPGCDFLTWLMCFGETRGGMLKTSEGHAAVMVEGPLQFVKGDTGRGSKVTVVRQGEPMLSPETKAALVDGKKLARARVTLAIGDRAWSMTIDGCTMTIRGLRLPPGEKLDAVSAFQERMSALAVAVNLLLSFWNLCIAELSTTRDSDQLLDATERWIKERRVRS